MGFVSANDDNSTTESLLLSDESSPISDIPDNETKEIPEISINSSQAYFNESIDIYLKDKDNNPLGNQNLTITIDNTIKNDTTDSDGKISLKLNFKPGKYLLNVAFIGNETVESVNQSFNIKILKFDSFITPVNKTVISGTYFQALLKGQNGEEITGENIIFKINGNSYNDDTDKKGNAGFKVKLAVGKYSLTITFKGNDYYNSVSETLNLIVPATTTVTIGNTKLLTNGYLRIYLKSSTPSAVSKKTVTITIGGKTFKKTSNSEGIIIFKPEMGTGTLKIIVKFDGTSNVIGCSAQKSVKGIKGNVKNPLKAKINLINGVPDIDLMPGNYVLADGDSTYTLTKAQYREVIKRDSYCLFLKNKLPKYTFFKSKAEPKLNHIIKREKWNVIERAVNTKIVLKNNKNYWPSKVTVSLKGKSYTYCEVRDIQNTGYTCGPTSASMCTQVLKNYFNEKYLSQLSGTSSYWGSSTKGLKKGLEKKNFKCTLYYKSSYKKALKQLKKGGCALIFHTWNHYISILDISKDGKKVLVGNPSGDYNHGSHSIPTKWLTVKYMKGRFNNYDTSGLIVKLKYNLKKSTKNKLNNYYSSMGAKWPRKNVSERIPDIGM
ncbi:cysteine peptidase family C39 domain-containing protein [Methanobrevibacter sp.]|uniref:cysteine peptidase family C39 domain-containing protein n=1 Tax=Methanobrevibacter sp. TaxID=66852 RepID=UPI0025D79AB4|nr:cysteine peptidase family C39 domain-containing protein [Methanobrevibacter sp.]MBR4448230.1 hypothetical protein [Methanobrevibacter sp.]